MLDQAKKESIAGFFCGFAGGKALLFKLLAFSYFYSCSLSFLLDRNGIKKNRQRKMPALATMNIAL